MSSNTVAEFATELKKSPETLLDQLKAAGVGKASPADALTESDKQKLLAFVSLIQALPVPMLSAGNHHIQTDLIRRLAGAVTWIKAQADEI